MRAYAVHRRVFINAADDVLGRKSRQNVDCQQPLMVVKGVFGFAAQVFFYAHEFAVLEIADVGGCAAAVHALLELGMADFIIQFGGVVVLGECHAGEIAYAVDGLFRLPETGGKQVGE